MIADAVKKVIKVGKVSLEGLWGSGPWWYSLGSLNRGLTLQVSDHLLSDLSLCLSGLFFTPFLLIFAS